MSTEYQVGDMFFLADNWARKCKFQIRDITASGHVTCDDLNEDFGNRFASPVVYSFLYGLGGKLEERGAVQWLIKNGVVVSMATEPKSEPSPRMKKILAREAKKKAAQPDAARNIAKADAAVEFMFKGAPVPYTVGTEGMLFEMDG